MYSIHQMWCSLCSTLQPNLEDYSQEIRLEMQIGFLIFLLSTFFQLYNGMLSKLGTIPPFVIIIKTTLKIRDEEVISAPLCIPEESKASVNGFAKWFGLLHAGSVIALVVFLWNCLSPARMISRNYALCSHIPSAFLTVLQFRKNNLNVRWWLWGWFPSCFLLWQSLSQVCLGFPCHTIAITNTRYSPDSAQPFVNHVVILTILICFLQSYSFTEFNCLCHRVKISNKL